MTDELLTLHKQYLAIFSEPAGKAVLADLYTAGMLMQKTFDPDPMRAAYNEGKRALALRIFNMLDTQRFERMLTEQKKG